MRPAGHTADALAMSTNADAKRVSHVPSDLPIPRSQPVSTVSLSFDGVTPTRVDDGSVPA